MENYLEGIHCSLREVREDDIPVMRKWLNDKIVTRFLHRGAYPFDLNEQRNAHLNLDKMKEVVFTVVNSSGEPIGTAGLHEFDWFSRSAEFRVLIGDRNHWGKGVGTEVVQLLTAYAFEVLNMNKVYLGVSEENIGAYKCYQKSGFVEEGVLREDVYRSNKYFDVVRMSLLKREYLEKIEKWKLKDRIKEQFPG